MSAPVVALTGSTGFIGRHLLGALQARGYHVRVLLRRPSEVPGEASSAVIGDIASPRNMAAALRGVDAVVHSAAIAHAMTGRPEDDYRSINTEATIGLARAAEKAGIKRFVFLSSIRAQTGPTAPGILTEADAPAPTDPYGRSKLAAEQGLAELAMDWVALRPVLVYGPGVKGNMAALLDLARSPFPLPLGGLKAKRSILSVDNLAAGVDAVLKAQGPIRRPLLVADPEPLTVAEMVAALREGLGRKPGLLPVPTALLKAAARLAKREEAFERLAGSLVVDPGALRAYGWEPAAGSREGLARLARSAGGA
ncbi:MAG TPA: NAD-dependent epimerase/dehydratase family protein [Microvirga sp.]|jgi:UDP-glucose 4-epimerase